MRGGGCGRRRGRLDVEVLQDCIQLGVKRTAANVVFAALGWWSTIASLPDASWLSVTGDI